MKSRLKNNFKTTLVVLAILLVSVIMAYSVEDYFRRFVRFSFTLFNGNHIRFVGKNFHLFASPTFVIASCLFNVVAYFFLRAAPLSRRQRALQLIPIFFAATFLITALDSYRLVIECTGCVDGIRSISYNKITYDNYFIASLSMAAMYLMVCYMIDRRRLKKQKSEAHDTR